MFLQELKEVSNRRLIVDRNVQIAARDAGDGVTVRRALQSPFRRPPPHTILSRSELGH
jgi:hypothetical protein